MPPLEFQKHWLITKTPTNTPKIKTKPTTATPKARQKYMAKKYMTFYRRPHCDKLYTA